MENNELFVKCPTDNKITLIKSCYLCDYLFQIQYIGNGALVECEKGKTTSIPIDKIKEYSC